MGGAKTGDKIPGLKKRKGLPGKGWVLGHHRRMHKERGHGVEEEKENKEGEKFRC